VSKRDDVIKLRGDGLTYEEIAERVGGITKERVRQILKGNPKPKPRLKIMLTTGEVSQLLGVHINTVRRWSRTGRLPAYRISTRGDRRFRREDIDSFLKREWGVLICHS